MGFGRSGAGNTKTPLIVKMRAIHDMIFDDGVKLFVSLCLGALIGAEREYKGRNIGFRTIILITLGSTFFTIISYSLGADTDPSRLASNIVTGVGFLGAGAIFRDGISVKGITTASIIWISAAIGMACGIGQFEFAALVTAFVLVILIGFTGVQKFIDNYNKEMTYRITITNNESLKDELENDFKQCRLKFYWEHFEKRDEDLVIHYKVRGAENNHEKLLALLLKKTSIKHFSV